MEFEGQELRDCFTWNKNGKSDFHQNNSFSCGGYAYIAISVPMGRGSATILRYFIILGAMRRYLSAFGIRNPNRGDHSHV